MPHNVNKGKIKTKIYKAQKKNLQATFWE